MGRERKEEGRRKVRIDNTTGKGEWEGVRVKREKEREKEEGK
jgi:hypothetical protein